MVQVQRMAALCHGRFSGRSKQRHTQFTSHNRHRRKIRTANLPFPSTDPPRAAAILGRYACWPAFSRHRNPGFAPCREAWNKGVIGGEATAPVDSPGLDALGLAVLGGSGLGPPGGSDLVAFAAGRSGNGHGGGQHASGPGECGKANPPPAGACPGEISERSRSSLAPD